MHPSLESVLDAKQRSFLLDHGVDYDDLKPISGHELLADTRGEVICATAWTDCRRLVFVDTDMSTEKSFMRFLGAEKALLGALAVKISIWRGIDREILKPWVR